MLRPVGLQPQLGSNQRPRELRSRNTDPVLLKALQSYKQADPDTLYQIFSEVLGRPNETINANRELFRSLFQDQDLPNRAQYWSVEQCTMLSKKSALLTTKNQEIAAKLLLSPEFLYNLKDVPIKDKSEIISLSGLSEKKDNLIGVQDFNSLINIQDSNDFCRDQTVSEMMIARTARGISQLIKGGKLHPDHARPYFSDTMIGRIGRSDAVTAKLIYLEVASELNINSKRLNIFGKSKTIKEFKSIADKNHVVFAAILLHRTGFSQKIVRQILTNDFLIQLRKERCFHLDEVLTLLVDLEVPKNILARLLEESYVMNQIRRRKREHKKHILLEALLSHSKLKAMVSPKLLERLSADQTSRIRNHRHPRTVGLQAAESSQIQQQTTDMLVVEESDHEDVNIVPVAPNNPAPVVQRRRWADFSSDDEDYDYHDPNWQLV